MAAKIVYEQGPGKSQLPVPIYTSDDVSKYTKDLEITGDVQIAEDAVSSGLQGREVSADYPMFSLLQCVFTDLSIHLWWFNFKLESIFATALVASKNDVCI